MEEDPSHWVEVTGEDEAVIAREKPVQVLRDDGGVHQTDVRRRVHIERKRIAYKLLLLSSGFNVVVVVIVVMGSFLIGRLLEAPLVRVQEGRKGVLLQFFTKVIYVEISEGIEIWDSILVYGI